MAWAKQMLKSMTVHGKVVSRKSLPSSPARNNSEAAAETPPVCVLPRQPEQHQKEQQHVLREESTPRIQASFTMIIVESRQASPNMNFFSKQLENRATTPIENRA